MVHCSPGDEVTARCLARQTGRRHPIRLRDRRSTSIDVQFALSWPRGESNRTGSWTKKSAPQALVLAGFSHHPDALRRDLPQRVERGHVPPSCGSFRHLKIRANPLIAPLDKEGLAMVSEGLFSALLLLHPQEGKCDETPWETFCLSSFSLLTVGTGTLASKEPVQPGLQASKRVNNAGILGSREFLYKVLSKTL